MPPPDPLLRPVPIAELRPTQMTIGLHEVAEKRRIWHQMPDAERGAFLGRHMIPVLLGPRGRHYVIDHHHLARALLDEGGPSVLVTVVADLSTLDKEAFWVFVDNRNWCHPYDADGKRKSFADIPKRIADLTDDPFRSLAGGLRRVGGFAKGTVPFDEFLWADALRRRIERKTVEKSFSVALTAALTFAKSHEARYLPGWCGPDPG